MSESGTAEVVVVTAISQWMDRLADRWARRMTFPGSPSDPPGPQAVIDASGEHAAQIDRAPADVWALLSTPGAAFTSADAFAIPGSVPERWCLVQKVAGGLLGTLVEVAELEEGRRIVLRRVGPETTMTWDWSVFDAGGAAEMPVSLVRVVVSGRVRGVAASGAARGLHVAAQRAVQQLDHLLTGAPPPSPLTGAIARGRVSTCEHRSDEPLGRGEVDVQVVVPVPVEDAWRGVLDAGTYTVDAAPGEQGGVVPGTPPGQVGELRYLICPLDGRLVVRLHEVVAVGPGHRLVLRHHSASHPTDSVITVEPHPSGATVRMVCEVVAHGDPTPTVDAVRTLNLAHLARFADEMIRRAAADAEPPSAS